ncbi:hypothetical protein [Sulfurimonas indica]|uniref:hypothetical protein n=1 Tax=Sulfurimonas indica TaxID=2508707 RepID=UPI0012656955|nr:hypothetical protein [Sulfurimonas indica]
MKKITMSAVALTAIMGSFSSVSAADGINILDDLVLDGQIRPRFEMVDDNNPATKNANAYTARTKLKVTGKLLGVDGLSASVGIISVNDFGSNTYNSTSNSQTDYAIVADPEKAMISNAEVNYKVGDTLLHAGRGQVNLDNQRFIGTVGWRQLERSYDSVFVANNSINNLSLLAAWVYGVQGVKSLAGDNGLYGENTYDTNTVLLHAAYTVNDALKITAYDYMIASLHDTYGIALTGKVKVDSAALTYRAEYAVQKDATMEIHNEKGKADASYYNLDLGANISGILAGVNYEFLSGASGTETAFACTLGTNHKFNGWADQFLATPTGGLIDANVRLGYKAKGFGKLLAVYHDFSADTAMTLDTGSGTGDDLGSEFDVVYVNKIPGVNGLTGMLKYADYSKGTVGGKNDKQVFWAMLDYKFSTK